jgi:hypothetical protein
MSVCKRKQLLLKYLLAKEIEDEEMLSAPRLEKHAIFKRRQGERYFKILINNHVSYIAYYGCILSRHDKG